MKVIGRGVLIILVGAVVVELGLRLVLGLGSPPLLTSHEEVGYLFRADQNLIRFTNRVHINGYHQRSEDISIADSSRISRLLFLGDSITWGGVLTDQSETYPELLEARLANWCGHPVEALNASAGSWGIGNLRAYAKHFGLFGSDLVAVQIGEGDLIQPKSDSSGIGSWATPRRAPTSAVAELVFRYLWPRAEARWERWTRIETNEGTRPSKNQGDQISEPKRQQFSRNMRHLRALTAQIRSSGKSLVLIYVPEKNNLLPGDRSPPPLYFRFRHWIDDHKISVFDIQDRWKGRKSVKKYYRDPIHLNERGNRALARGLSQWIRSEKISIACRQ